MHAVIPSYSNCIGRVCLIFFRDSFRIKASRRPRLKFTLFGVTRLVPISQYYTQYILTNSRTRKGKYFTGSLPLDFANSEIFSPRKDATEWYRKTRILAACRAFQESNEGDKHRYVSWEKNSHQLPRILL